jgi:hypothetical protein
MPSKPEKIRDVAELFGLPLLSVAKIAHAASKQGKAAGKRTTTIARIVVTDDGIIKLDRPAAKPKLLR